jgi:putative ABC transport system permease protein
MSSMFHQYFLLAGKEFKRRKLRSLLTLIGIIIGVAAIVSLITLGQGLKNAIDDQFDALGKDKLFISAKGNALTPGLTIDAVKITEDDLEVVKQTSGIKRAAGLIYSTGRIEFNEIVRYNFVSGMPEESEDRALVGEANSYKIMKGRSFEKGDRYRAVLGYSYTEPTFFEKSIELGDTIIIQDRDFKVIGFLEKIGSPPDDQGIQIPLDIYASVFDTGDELGILIAQTDSGENVEFVAAAVEKDLRNSRDVEEGKEDFTVQTPQQLAGSFATILDIVQVVLVGIASISLLVGGIGIMNTMYTAVLQRTREIGVLKALGAQNKHILSLFLVESGLYGLGGGFLGVSIGVSLALLTEQLFFVFVGPAFLSIEINMFFILGVLLFSFIVGVLSGIAPAYGASKLNPVDSLRYE